MMSYEHSSANCGCLCCLRAPVEEISKTIVVKLPIFHGSPRVFETGAPKKISRTKTLIFVLMYIEMQIQQFQSPKKSNRKNAARINDERFYCLLGLAINHYKTFSTSPEVRGGCAFGFRVMQPTLLLILLMIRQLTVPLIHLLCRRF